MATYHNVSALDSNLYCTTFGNDEMRRIMGDGAYEARMVEVEVQLAQVQAGRGIIPREAADDIAASCTIDKLDRQRLRHDTEIVGLPVWGLVRQLVELAGNDSSGRYVHWGLNTHDIMDLALALQMKDGLQLISRQLDEVRGALVRLIHHHRHTPMVARTHLQHALPTTFGCRAAIWLSGLDRHAERLSQLKPRVLLAEVGGASGSLASFGSPEDGHESDGLKTSQALAQALDLFEPPMPWHAARDGLTEVVSFLTMVGGSLAKIALDVILMQMPEIGEVAEPFVPHRGASSTMPHKNNPVLSEIILTLSKLLRQDAALAFEALPADFERAGSGAWHVEWACVSQSFVHCSAALKHSEELLKGLRVSPEKMWRNLMSSQGLVAAEHVVVAIADFHGRSRAHDIIYECVREVVDSDKTLAEVLKTHLEVTSHLSHERIDFCCDPSNYLGSTQLLIDRQLAGR